MRATQERPTQLGWPGEQHNNGAPAAVDTKPRQLIDIVGLAGRLGVTERFVRRLIAERRVPFFKIGKFIRFDPQEIEDWIDKRKITPNEMRNL